MSVLRLRNTNTPGKCAQVMYTFVYVYICTHIHTYTNTYKMLINEKKCLGVNKD